MDKDELDYKKQLREDLMSEEELKLSDKYIDFFRSSWRDKELRGLFDKWECADRYWEGDVNLPESDDDPASNINIVHSNVEGQVAMLVEQNIGIESIPTGPSDKPYADTVTAILEWIIQKNKIKRKLDIHERRREKYGTGIFRVTYDAKALKGFGLPRIETCNPAYVFVDPTITDVYKVQEGRFIIETVNKSISWADNNPRFIEERADAIIPGYTPMEFDYLFGEDDGENDDISKDSYLHLYVWTKHKGKIRLVEMSACGVILYDSKKHGDDVFPDEIYPYFFTPLYYREGTVWGKSDTELLINLQDLINDLDDQIRINTRLTGNIQRLVSTSSGIDIDKWTNEPGLVIPCQGNIDTAYRVVSPPPMQPYPIDRRKYALEYESAKVTRFSDQSTGIRQTGVDTATEAMALQQAGTAGIGYKKLLLQETLSEVMEYVLKLVKEYYTEEKAFRITEKKDEFLWFKGSKLKKIPKLVPATNEFKQKFNEVNPDIPPPELMQEEGDGGEGITKEADFDIEVTVGAGMPTNKSFVYTVINEAFAKGAITVQEFRKLLKEYVALPVEEEPPMQPLGPMTNQGGGTPGMPQSPNIMGMTANGNPGGGM